MIMKLKHLLALILAALPLISFSQTEFNDSISFGRNKPDNVILEGVANPDSIPVMTHNVAYNFTYTPALNPLFPRRIARPHILRISDMHFSPGRASLFHWNSGEIVASGGTRSYPGLMRIDSGELGINQSVGNFIFHAGGMVNKYGYFNGLHTQYGLNGNISYQFMPRLSATFFGEFYFGQPSRMANGMPMPPAVIGHYGRSAFGGYFDIQINERWGVQTGVQTVQQVGTNRYKAEPIATPYYRISKKVAIGLPVGQILYHVLKK